MTLLGGRPRTARRHRRRTPSPAGAVGYTEVGVGGDRSGRSTPIDGADAAFLLEPTPVAVDRRGRPGRRRHAPEIDLLLSQGPDRPGHQPSRMVSPMPDTTPEQILARAQVPPANGRPIRKDEIELDERGIYIESWLPERRSRRKPLLFVHGELAGSWAWERYLGLLRRARLGGPRPQPAQPSLVADGGPDHAVIRYVHGGRGRRRSNGSAPASSWSATGWAASSRSRPSSGCRFRA